MAGLEAAAFVLNTVDASYKVIAAAVAYGQKVKAAKECMKSIRSEVDDITELLNDLHLRACKASDSHDDSQVQQWASLHNISSRESTVSLIRLELNTILDFLNAQKLSKIENLLWPRKLKKVEKSMQLIAKQKERLSERLRIDTASVHIEKALSSPISALKRSRFQTIETDKKIAKIARSGRSVYNIYLVL